MAKTERTQYGQVFENVRAKEIDIQGRLATTDAVVRYFVEGLWATVSQSVRSLVANYCAGVNKPVGEVFRASSFCSHFHADTGIGGITLGILRGAASEGATVSTSYDGVFDWPVGNHLIEF